MATQVWERILVSSSFLRPIRINEEEKVANIVDAARGISKSRRSGPRRGWQLSRPQK
jgi:hypothetical protein